MKSFFHLVSPAVSSLAIHFVFALLFFISLYRVRNSVDISIPFQVESRVSISQGKSLSVVQNDRRNQFPKKIQSDSVQNITSEITPDLSQSLSGGKSFGAFEEQHLQKDGSSRSDLIHRIREKIDSAIQYPASLRRRRIQGRVQVLLTLDEDGKVKSTELTHSSGHPELDDLALQAIRDAAPFEKQMGRLELNLPIEFKLSE